MPDTWTECRGPKEGQERGFWHSEPRGPGQLGPWRPGWPGLRLTFLAAGSTTWDMPAASSSIAPHTSDSSPWQPGLLTGPHRSLHPRNLLFHQHLYRGLRSRPPRSCSPSQPGSELLCSGACGLRGHLLASTSVVAKHTHLTTNPSYIATPACCRGSWR